MSYRQNAAAMTRRKQLATDQTDDPLALGFGASVSTAFEAFRAEDTTTSEQRAVERFHGLRNSALNRMVEEGDIPAAVVEQNKVAVGMNQITGLAREELDYHALAAWANDNTGSQFDTDDSEMIETMRWERRERQRQLANGNWLGEGIGTMGASLTDPALLGLTVATLPLGAGALPARGALQSVVVRTALVEGMVGMASEVPIQAEVMDFKARIDSPYGFEDAVQNILLAGTASAVLGAGVAAAAKGASKFLANRSPEAFTEAAANMENPDTARLVDEFGRFGEIEDPPGTVGQHLDRLMEAEQRANGPEIPEPEPVPEPRADAWEPEDPAEWDLEVETEAGEVRTLREVESEYAAELRIEEEQLDALSACALLPSEAA